MRFVFVAFFCSSLSKTATVSAIQADVGWMIVECFTSLERVSLSVANKEFSRLTKLSNQIDEKDPVFSNC
jgi:hypothetical protein